MGIEKSKCQMCGQKYNEDKLSEEWSNMGIPYSASPVSFLCCSFACHHRAYKANGIINFVRFVRNIQSLPLETFSEIFDFNKAGGYAEEKWIKAKTQPWLFVTSLSNDKLKKLVNQTQV